MAQKKPKTLDQKMLLLSEKFVTKQISEKDFLMWEKVYAEQWKAPRILPKNYHGGGIIKSKKKVMLPELDDYRMSNTEIRHFNAE
jgi:hypothetical protein